MQPSRPPSEIAPNAKVLCLGCGRAFSHFGRISHLAQTRNPPCREIASQERTTQADSESNFEETHAPDGDFYGAFDEDEMPWTLARWRADDLDADVEEDAPMDDADGPPTDSQDMDDEDDSSEDDLGNLDEEDVVHDGGGSIGTNEDHVVIETFPSQYGDAGAAMERGSGSLYKKYNNNCLRDLDDNMYAPFKSKLDWDFARWAKLRGPGSTAINELLSIDGVSIMILFQNYV
jgi:hypothetical protein